MLKLYRKSELYFALACILVYVIVFGNLRSMGDDKPYMAMGHLIFTGILLGFIRSSGLAGKYGLTSWVKNSKAMLYLLPLWFITSGNLWGPIAPNYSMPGLLYAIISFALVGFEEEMLFRGFLFKAMLKDGSPRTAIIVSSLTFGIGHIVNLLTGHGGFETAAQMVFAVAIGFVFTMVFYKGGSLLPCIISHSLIDVFSVFCGRSDLAAWIYLGSALLVSLTYGLYLNRLETPVINK